MIRSASAAEEAVDVGVASAFLSFLGLLAVGFTVIYARLAWVEAQKGANAAVQVLRLETDPILFLTIASGQFRDRLGNPHEGNTADPIANDGLPGQWRYRAEATLTNAGRVPVMLVSVAMNVLAADDEERIFPGPLEKPTLVKQGDVTLLPFDIIQNGTVRKGYWDKTDAPFVYVRTVATYETPDGRTFVTSAAWLHADSGEAFQRFGGSRLNFTRQT